MPRDSVLTDYEKGKIDVYRDSGDSIRMIAKKSIDHQV